MPQVKFKKSYIIIHYASYFIPHPLSSHIIHHASSINMHHHHHHHHRHHHHHHHHTSSSSSSSPSSIVCRLPGLPSAQDLKPTSLRVADNGVIRGDGFIPAPHHPLLGPPMGQGGGTLFTGMAVGWSTVQANGVAAVVITHNQVVLSTIT